VDANGKLILTVGIRSCFDYFFSSLGEKTETELISDIRQYLKATLPDSASSYASYLLDQYVAYTHALKNLKPTSSFTTGDAEGFQKYLIKCTKFSSNSSIQQKLMRYSEMNVT
jgi:lipase chaperone LimK